MPGQKVREKNHLPKRSQNPKSMNPKGGKSSPSKSKECNTHSTPKLQTTPVRQRTSNISSGSSLGSELFIDSCNIQLSQLNAWDHTLRMPARPQGIDRGLVLDKIFKSFQTRGETFLIVKWKGLFVLDAVLLNRLTELYPHIVIEYFEKLDMRCESIFT